MRERGQSAHIEVHITDQELAPSYELGQQIFAAWAEKPPDDIDLAAYAIRHAAATCCST